MDAQSSVDFPPRCGCECVGASMGEKEEGGYHRAGVGLG